jgi:lysozyme
MSPPNVTQAPPPLLRGIDVSHYQGHVDWPAVAAAGYSFTWCKLTEGAGYVDPTGVRNLAAARVAGLHAGAYHFFRGSGAAEAAHFLAALPPDVDALPPRLPPALDLEATLPDGAAEEALTWLRIVHDATGVAPVVYVSPAWAQVHRLDRWPAFGNYGLWLAEWSVVTPKPPAPWDSWLAWQTGAGEVPGVGGSCDVDVARASLVGA